MATAPAKDAVLYFATPEDLRRWFAKNHESRREQWIGFHKKGSGRPSITWPESVDEALCVGWIDGLRKTVDAESYKIRFTPRKRTSIWSAVNVARVAALTRDGRMQPAGLAAFAKRTESKSLVYAYENRDSAKFSAEQERQFRASRAAWKFFQAQAPWYRRVVTWRVISAKRPETREKRLAHLITECEAGRRIR
jgi:uncharacterized protein YdeI (YjbR/CyaY-like superfamily)